MWDSWVGAISAGYWGMTQADFTDIHSTPIFRGLLLSGATRDLFGNERLALVPPVPALDPAPAGDEGSDTNGHLALDPRGRAELSTFYQVRKLTHAANEQVGAHGALTTPLETGRVGAIGCLNSVWRQLLELWRTHVNPDGFEQAMAWVRAHAHPELLQTAVQSFGESFPPEDLRRVGQCENLSVEQDLEGSAALVADLVTVRLLNENPAVAAERALFDDAPLAHDAYAEVIGQLEAFFDTQPGLAGANDGSAAALAGADADDPLLKLPLLKLLRAPIEQGGDSLFSQLEFLSRHFGHLLSPELLGRILSTLDVLREESRGRYHGPPGAPAPLQPPSFWGLEELGARFSPDADWMLELVLLAKNVHVWLAQLSRREGQHLHRLDQIPDRDLQELAERGIRGLWLIGLWERSQASRRIKELSGSPQVVSSAYSIYDYRIADDLGGEEAWQNLRQRAERLGIRMAADMVPNHMGITSTWVYEHPEWFIRRDDAPYPSYRFSGPDLSDNPRVGIYLEDHYYSRSDAAVVFKRVDHATGHTQFVYHGNDGTSMPWNDTAQIDYLNPEAREAVIQQILQVARRCSIIRFDAAMTLVKKHIQRLWFPQPGSGGAIPSRAEYALSQQDFERIMPREFWTEVVERVAREVPDTLLLAEAFWMMEGFFVRSLGMHRVYNSAFMNMLAREDNAGYRRVMKDTLEFDPQILRRYVNFMNNPDEDTAIAQFGKGDKYFGVATLMATMPGLPMIGHGQIEGFGEKYGMDFNEPRLVEEPDEGLIAEHRRRIFPLLRHRRAFAGVENFLLYDLNTGMPGHSAVDENVFAYSNRLGQAASLVIYHNRYAETRGWLRDSAAFRDKSHSDAGVITQKRLADGLAISAGDDIFVTFRDQVSGLEYIRHSRELTERGFFVQLGAYQCHVFLDFQQIRDTPQGTWRALYEDLNGRGTPSIAQALRRRELAPIHRPLLKAIAPDLVCAFARGEADAALIAAHLESLEPPPHEVLDAFRQSSDLTAMPDSDAAWVAYCDEVDADLRVLAAFQKLTALAPEIRLDASHDAQDLLPVWAALVAWAFWRPLGGATPGASAGVRVRSLWDDWSLDGLMRSVFEQLDIDPDTQRERMAYATHLLRFALSRQGWLADPTTWQLTPPELLDALLSDEDARQILRVNRHADILWYHGESFDIFMRWLQRFAAMAVGLKSARAGKPVELTAPDALTTSIKKIVASAEHADFQVERLRKRTARPAPPPRR